MAVVLTPQWSSETRDVTCRNVRVRTSEHGEGSPLLLLHDFLSDRQEWVEAGALLAERHRVIAVDLPGCGESERPRVGWFGYGFDAIADALLDLVGALDAAPLAVCGHGMGGAIALALAERHPAVVDKLVLVSPPLFGGRALAGARLATLPVIGPLGFKQLYGRGPFGRHFRKQVFAGHAPADALIDRLFDHFNAPAAREAAFAMLTALQDTRTLEAPLARVTAPTLIVWGRKDVLAPAAVGRKISRELPAARLELFDCGHSPAEEVPAQFAKAVLGFLTPQGRR